MMMGCRLYGTRMGRKNFENYDLTQTSIAQKSIVGKIEGMFHEKLICGWYRLHFMPIKNQ